MKAHGYLMQERITKLDFYYKGKACDTAIAMINKKRSGGENQGIMIGRSALSCWLVRSGCDTGNHCLTILPKKKIYCVSWPLIH